jgi:ribosomal protein S18 acetylase RimI-like enzyme
MADQRGEHVLPDSSQPWAIREYLPEDFETLYQLDQECFESGIAYTRRTLRLFLAQPGAECLVAEARSPGAEPRVLAFVLGDRRGKHGYIVTLDVAGAHRRRSIGTALLAALEDKFAAAGVIEVELETATLNQPAIALWQKHGYRACGILKHYYGNGQDAFLMTKPLGKPSPRRRAAGQAV